MIGADPGCDTKFEVFRLLEVNMGSDYDVGRGCNLFDELRGEVTGMEGSCDEDIGSRKLLLENAVRTLFAAGDLNGL